MRKEGAVITNGKKFEVKFPEMSCCKSDFYNKSVVVIGAGIAGLSAAFRLKEYGLKNVTVLEARSRVGGRIHSRDFELDRIEMGAQWIHGQKGNAIYDLAVQGGLLDESAISYEECLFSWSNVSCEEEKQVILDTVEFLEKKMCELEKNTHVAERNLFCYLEKCFKQYVSIHGSDHQLNHFRRRAFDWYVRYQCELNGCEYLSDVSVHLLHRYIECEGSPLIEMKHGYQSILDLLLQKIPAEWLLTNKEVRKVILQSGKQAADSSGTGAKLSAARTSSKCAQVICSDGSEYLADHVVVTIPLGCLKTVAESMFCPPLPQCKMDAIDAIGFGALNKVYLKYEEPFWEPGFILNLLWDSDIDWGTSYTADKRLQVSEDWYRYICRFSFVPHQPSLLCAWVSGIGATYMEKLTMKEVIADCQKVLEMTMKMNIPAPMDALRSQWVSDPFSKGCYSYLSVKCDEKRLNNLDIAVPVCITSECGQHPILLFGGEATHPHYYSTVHGAYETGLREADRIFFHYHNSHKTCTEIASLPKSLVKKTHIAIIGAGASGLSCAQRLTSAGLTDFVILEARDRIGGRIYTVPCEFSVLELGAQWIHGEDGNPLYEYCSQHNLLMDPKVDSTCEAKGLFCTSDGKIIPEDIVDEVMLKLQEIKEAVSSNQDSRSFCQSMKEVFQSGFEKYLCMCHDMPEQYSWKRGIFNFFLRFEVIDNACDSLQDITPLGYAAWAECPGQFYTCFKNGFSSFLDCLLKEIPVASVMMSKPVKCVYWAANSPLCTKDLDFPVLVACHDGDWVAAQHVVVTPSVGFLQQNMESFFSPCLPEHKMTAFTKTGFGTVSKIYLLFPKSFWKEDELGFQLVWLDGANEKEQFSMPETSWVNGITGFDRVFNQPNVLVTWVGGPYAKQVEEVPDEVVGRTCVDLLRVFLKDRDIPFPLKVIRFCWFNDEYIRGAYSCRTKQFFEAGCSVKDLSEPLLCSYTLKNGRTVQWPVVLFAGEAMDKEYFSAVHGALRSGWTEADRIIQFSDDLKKMKS